MTQRVHQTNGRHSASLHPLIYKLIAGAAAWMVLSAWGFAGSNGYVGVDLVVVTGLVFVMVAIPTLLWLIWHKYREPQRDQLDRPSLHDWLLGDFEAWQRHLKGSEAIVAILLPLGAAAFGMTFFVIAKHIAVGSL
jgi:hypothetical protein